MGDAMCLRFGGETRPVACSGAWPKVWACVTITSWTVTERQCVENLRLAASAWKPRRHFSGAGSDEVGACRERFPSGSMILVASTVYVGSQAMDRQFEHVCLFMAQSRTITLRVVPDSTKEPLSQAENCQVSQAVDGQAKKKKKNQQPHRRGERMARCPPWPPGVAGGVDCLVEAPPEESVPTWRPSQRITVESECQRSMYLNLWNADFNMISVWAATDELDLENRLIEEVDKHDEQNAVELDVPIIQFIRGRCGVCRDWVAHTVRVCCECGGHVHHECSSYCHHCGFYVCDLHLDVHVCPGAAPD